jgi:dynamin 1-like protein
MALRLMQEVDPCDDLTDEDIRTAIQNATGPKNVLFVPEVQLKTVLPFWGLKSWCIDAKKQ